IVVLANRQALVKSTFPFQHSAIDQYRTGTNDAKWKAAMKNPSGKLAMLSRLIDSTAISNPDFVGVENSEFRRLRDRFELPLQLSRLPWVVTIEKSKPRPFAGANAMVARRAHSTSRLVDITNSRIAQPDGELGGPVG